MNQYEKLLEKYKMQPKEAADKSLTWFRQELNLMSMTTSKNITKLKKQRKNQMHFFLCLLNFPILIFSKILMKKNLVNRLMYFFYWFLSRGGLNLELNI